MAVAGEYVVVRMTDAGGTQRQFNNGDVTSVDLGTTFDQFDVAGFGDLAHKFINGQLKAPITVKGFMTTDLLVGTHTIMQPVFAQGKTVTLRVAIGNNATPVPGTSQEFSGSFIVETYKLMLDTGKAVTFEASLKPATGAGPAWGLMA